MRKIFTFLILCFLGQFLFAQGDDCTASTSSELIDCINDAVNRPATITIDNPVNNADLNISAAGPLDLSDLTIVLDLKVQLEFSGDITINSGTSFTMSNGNITFTYNSSVFSGPSGATELNNLIQNCGCMTLEQALPVELTRFEAQPKNNMVELAWTTATELNNDFFQIEHSRDGIQFFPVGKVKGEGTTTETIHYNFMHRQPIAGTNYYRLKQVDFDGAFEYSDIVVAEISNRSGGIRIFPNPTVNKAVIQMPQRPDIIKFRLANLIGQYLDIQPKQTDAGWEIDLSKVAKGIYILRMEYDGKVVSKRIVKE